MTAKKSSKEGAYKCLYCGRNVSIEDAKKRVRCVHCGRKILYKTRHISTVVRAI